MDEVDVIGKGNFNQRQAVIHFDEITLPSRFADYDHLWLVSTPDAPNYLVYDKVANSLGIDPNKLNEWVEGEGVLAAGQVHSGGDPVSHPKFRSYRRPGSGSG